MFDNLYIVKDRYVYNKANCRIFDVSEDLINVLKRYSGILELKESDVNLYNKIENILKILNTPRKGCEKKKKMASIQLLVCNECNMACKYCYAHCGTYNEKSIKMDFDTAKNAIDFMYSQYEELDTITFFGGEPLLCVDLIEQICQYVYDNYDRKFKSIGMMTNLYQLTDEAIDVIKKYNINIATSLDGNKLMNKYRISKNGEETYEIVVGNILKLHRITSQPIAVETTMSDLHNVHGYDDNSVVRELKNILPIKQYTVNRVEDIDGKMKEHMYIGKEVCLHECVEQFIEQGLFDMRINDLVSIIKGTGCGNMLCTAGCEKYNIMPNGDIYPCQIYALDKNKRYFMGNVNNIDMEFFYRKKCECIKLNDKNSYDKCRECNAKAICTSCMGLNVVNDNLLPHNEQYCIEKNKYYDELINIYVELLEDAEKMTEFKKQLAERGVALCKNY